MSVRGHWLSLALAAIGVAALTTVLASAACSDNQDVSKTVKNVTPSAKSGGTSTGGTEGGPETTSKMPASRFSPAREELPGVYSVNVPETFTQNISTFASSYLFSSNQQGQDLGTKWRIIDGFKALYDPDGLAAGVAQGKYYISIEVYLFEVTSGAVDAYDYMDKLFSGRAGTDRQDAKGLGNKSAGYKIIQGTVGTSDIPQAYHRFMFRRGNVVAVVQTTGGAPTMTIDKARDIAVIIDDRILGKRDATEPTPIPTPKISLPPQVTPTAVGGR